MSERLDPDPGIDRLVRATTAIDDHAHPIPLEWEPPADGTALINPYDHPLPLRMRQTNPEYVDAWRALWGYTHDDTDAAHLRTVVDSKRELQQAQGAAEYHQWVLDQINVDTMLAVDYSPQPSLPAPRFRWLSFSDWLMWPVPVAGPPEAPLVGAYAQQIDAAYRRAGFDGPPETLDEYVSGVLDRELEQRRADGAVGLKFHTPYYRPIDFGDVTESQAQRIYAGGRDGGVSPADHRTLEDFLFARIARKAAELELPVQMHTGQGPKPHFQNAGSDPLLMEPAVVAAPDTRFVMLHAGWPFDRQAVASLSHDNVYMDISCATVHLFAHNLADILRNALEWFPEKVLYGTDAYSDVSIGILSGIQPRPNPLQGWEEKAWLLDRTARDALSLALTAMHRDGVIRSDDVERLTRMVLHDNALNLYHL